MGTRSLTYVRESEKSAAFLCIYRQYDGYPAGMGRNLYEMLKGYKLVNGYTSEDSECVTCGEQPYSHNRPEIADRYPKAQGHEFVPKRVANGINDLAASIVKGLKDGIGNVYLYNTRTKDAGQEYNYDLYLNKGTLTMKITTDEPSVVYQGPVDEFNKFLEKL